MDRIAIKKKAKEFAYKNKWNVWKAVLLVSILTGIINGVSSAISGGDEKSTLYYLLTIVVEFALLPMQVGLASYLLKLVRGKKVNLVDELFSKYKSEYIWKIMVVNLISGLIIFGFSLLLVIPGIIYAIKYAMLSFILAEQTSKEMQEEKAYKVSEKLMDGHKWEYVVFQLSFVGWIILSSLTFGILLIWILPYMTIANVMWYDELKKLNNKKKDAKDTK